MSMLHELDKNPSTSLLIMILLKKLNGRVEITETDIIFAQAAKWSISKNDVNSNVVLELK